MALVGPGAVKDEDISPGATLDGATELEFVTIINPLSDDFAIQVAQTTPVNAPIEIRHKTSAVQSAQDLQRNYSIDLKNPNHTAKAHIHNRTVVRAGEQITLRGDEAQVAVRQLVNEVLQREGKHLLLGNPKLRREVEERIIVSRGNVQELMNNKLQSTRQVVDEAIAATNNPVTEEVQDEAGFQDLGNTATSQANTGISEATEKSTGENQTQPRRSGRPRKQVQQS